MVEVEVLDGLSRREPGGADADLTAVGLAGGDLALQAGGEELLVAPALGRARSASRSTEAASDGAFSARHR